MKCGKNYWNVILAGSWKADRDRVIADKIDRNVGLGFDRMAIHLGYTIPPMPHCLHRGYGERAVAADDINLGYGAIRPDDCSQADFARQAGTWCFRVAESALRWLRNLQPRLRRRVLICSHWSRNGEPDDGRTDAVALWLLHGNGWL